MGWLSDLQLAYFDGFFEDLHFLNQRDGEHPQVCGNICWKPFSSWKVSCRCFLCPIKWDSWHGPNFEIRSLRFVLHGFIPINLPIPLHYYQHSHQNCYLEGIQLWPSTVINGITLTYVTSWLYIIEQAMNKPGIAGLRGLCSSPAPALQNPRLSGWHLRLSGHVCNGQDGHLREASWMQIPDSNDTNGYSHSP